MPKRRVTIEERPNRRQICETKMRYAVMFDGQEFDELYWNMTGYVGTVPYVRDDGTVGKLGIGERGISEYRREVARTNRELSNA